METRIAEDEISLTELYMTLVKSKKFIVSLALIGGLLGGTLTLILKPRLYESSCLMRLGVVLDRPIEPMDRLIEVLKEPNTLIQIAKVLDLSAESKVLEKLKKRLLYANRVGLLEIKACMESPKESVRYVNAVSQLVLDRHEILFQRYKDLYESQLNDMLNIYKQNPLNVDARTLPLVTEPTELIVPPAQPILPLSRGIAKNSGIGFMLGALVGIIKLVLEKNPQKTGNK